MGGGKQSLTIAQLGANPSRDMDPLAQWITRQTSTTRKSGDFGFDPRVGFKTTFYYQ